MPAPPGPARPYLIPKGPTVLSIFRIHFRGSCRRFPCRGPSRRRPRLGADLLEVRRRAVDPAIAPGLGLDAALPAVMCVEALTDGDEPMILAGEREGSVLGCVLLIEDQARKGTKRFFGRQLIAGAAANALRPPLRPP